MAKTIKYDPSEYQYTTTLHQNELPQSFNPDVAPSPHLERLGLLPLSQMARFDDEDNMEDESETLMTPPAPSRPVVNPHGLPIFDPEGEPDDDDDWEDDDGEEWEEDNDPDEDDVFPDDDVIDVGEDDDDIPF